MANPTADLRSFGGRVLEPTHDPQLDGWVQQAAEQTRAPVALVSMVTGRIQFWKAAQGLPPELDISRATSRCDSYCQFVVEIQDVVRIEDNASVEYRSLSCNLVDRYGLRSYLGVPIVVHDAIAGSLCVLDVEPRTWTDDHVALMKELAIPVGKRLEQLASQPVEVPTIADVASAAEFIHHSLAELGPLIRLVGAARRNDVSMIELRNGLELLDELDGLYDDALEKAKHHRAQCRSLLGTSARTPPTD